MWNDSCETLSKLLSNSVSIEIYEGNSLNVTEIFLYMIVLIRISRKTQELQFTMNVIGVSQLDVSEVRVKFYLILCTLKIPNLDAFTEIYELWVALDNHSQLVVR